MAEMTFYVGMPDAEMHAILEASCGVEDCTIRAQALFHAATSKYSSVWQSVREELTRSHPGDASRPTYLLGALEPPTRANLPIAGTPGHWSGAGATVVAAAHRALER